MTSHTNITTPFPPFAQFDTTLYVVEAVLLLVGAWLCWMTKDVPDAVNESKFIAYSMTILALICALVLPIVFLINLSPAIQRLIASLAFAFGALFFEGILFGPKILLLLSEGDITDIAEGNKKKVHPVGGAYDDDQKSMERVPNNSKAQEDGGGGKGGTNAGLHSRQVSNSDMHGKMQQAPSGLGRLHGTSEQKSNLCREQMRAWQTLLLQIDAQDSSSGTGQASDAYVVTDDLQNKLSSSESTAVDPISTMLPNARLNPDDAAVMDV